MCYLKYSPNKLNKCLTQNIWILDFKLKAEVFLEGKFIGIEAHKPVCSWRPIIRNTVEILDSDYTLWPGVLWTECLQHSKMCMLEPCVKVFIPRVMVFEGGRQLGFLFEVSLKGGNYTWQFSICARIHSQAVLEGHVLQEIKPGNHSCTTFRLWDS